MRILAFTDMHGNKKALEKVVKAAKKADIIICCGDFTVFERDMDKMLARFDSIGKPFLIIPGNHEYSTHLDKSCQKLSNMICINESYYADDEIIILGIEGNGFIKVDSNFSKAAKRLAKILAKHKAKKYILVTHAPPYGTKVDKLEGTFCGNMSVREFIEKSRPVFALCGHLHENSYKMDKLGPTIVVNPGPEGTFIEI